MSLRSSRCETCCGSSKSVLKDVAALWPESPLRKELQELRTEFTGSLRRLDQTIATQAEARATNYSPAPVAAPPTMENRPSPRLRPLDDREDVAPATTTAYRPAPSVVSALPPASETAIRTDPVHLPDAAYHRSDPPKIISTQRSEPLPQLRQSFLAIFQRNKRP